MMMDKRLLAMVPDSKKFIAGNVVCQWISMVANAALVFTLGWLLEQLLAGRSIQVKLPWVAGIALVALVVRWFALRTAASMSHLASRQVKGSLRRTLFEKLYTLGASYRQRTSTAQVVQVAVEGVDQLEIYFGSYLPQFFYSLLAPVTLFLFLAPISLTCALVLLVCVPLIPVAIAAVQTFAKKLLAKYWGKYTSLGDHFLENLQGLTTLKIYQADGARQEEMAVQAEEFRKVTMKVLTMQLNSIVIMDLIAYGGAALGAILALLQLSQGHITPAGCFAIILLSAEFFLPMRLLGSFFHVAMNGMAAAQKIYALLDLEVPTPATETLEGNPTLECRDVTFSYDGQRPILQGVNLTIAPGSLTAVVGESGCGKSTLSALLMGRNQGYGGHIILGGKELSTLSENSLMAHCTYIGHRSYLFKGSVRDNLLLADPHASDDALWAVLEQVNLAAFLRGEQGLDTQLQEGGSNFSGGQRQRLALARALLHNSPCTSSMRPLPTWMWTVKMRLWSRFTVSPALIRCW
ncbi:ABC transporter ATP-binding protein/permease [Pseudoflavonifractor capillosus]|uniref:ABC transporter ATP-binding protein/permease n=1 Tax=Pseudoflavonifractor capillosus TaxID=106588 RepID=UPI0031F92B62